MILGSAPITVEQFFDFYESKQKIELDTKTEERIQQSFNNVTHLLQGDLAVYGVNTGFGPLCDRKISKENIALLQENLLKSHAVGVGKPISKSISKMMLLCKLIALSKGFSGVSLKLINKLIEFYNLDIIPVVPSQGSVGASGDLAPLSHLFLPIIGKGKVWVGDEICSTEKVLQQKGIQPIELQSKEGLALINGTQFILAHGLSAVRQMKRLLDAANVVSALSLEACQGSSKPFRKELHDVRPFRGTVEVAEKMRYLLEGSENIHSHIECNRVQDPYSLRCIPQVHGASLNTYYHLKELVEVELNSVTDNPIIINEEESISGGNFHGQPLAMALDYATVAVSELGNISDRRTYLMLDGKFGLPPMLTESPGLNSGFMIIQYTTAALASENKSLCFPASADSIPTSMGQEDHVSMGSISGRKLVQTLQNTQKIIAIECFTANQALEFRRPFKLSAFLETIREEYRQEIGYIKEDGDWDNQLEMALDWFQDKVQSEYFTIH